MRKFLNSTEAGFYDYMLSHKHYKDSTVLDYIRRIRKIESMDTLVYKDLTLYIDDFETGTHRNMNAASHNAYSCALKRLKEYQTYKDIVVS